MCPVQAVPLTAQVRYFSALLIHPSPPPPSSTPASQAGPPYEDIAFKVVNKEWNYARKHGFRCAYERGILHLFFNLKRTRYRR